MNLSRPVTAAISTVLTWLSRRLPYYVFVLTLCWQTLSGREKRDSAVAQSIGVKNLLFTHSSEPTWQIRQTLTWFLSEQRQGWIRLKWLLCYKCFALPCSVTDVTFNISWCIVMKLGPFSLRILQSHNKFVSLQVVKYTLYINDVAWSLIKLNLMIWKLCVHERDVRIGREMNKRTIVPLAPAGITLGLLKHSWMNHIALHTQRSFWGFSEFGACYCN